MRILIIGAVAAGTSAGAKARRNNEESEIVIYEKDNFISYSGCGMPYYIGGVVDNADDLTPRDPAFFKSKYNIDVLILHEVLSINPDNKTLEVKNLSSGEIFTDHYDKLVIATGARAFIPPIVGADNDNVFSLRNINDMNKIKDYIRKCNTASALIIGSGFVGLEVCENLSKLGIDVTMVEALPQVTPGLDSDMAVHVQKELEKNGVKVYTGVSASEIRDNSVILSDEREIQADFVLLSTGVRPNTELAAKAGVELGVTKAIKVDEKMRTNIEDIYSCGDCAEQFSVITAKPIYRPLGSTANKMGRIAGDSLTDGNLVFRGVLGTGIFRVFDMTVAQTGLSEKEAKAEGYDVAVVHNIKPNKPVYMGGKEMVIKGIADKASGRLLGVQIVGSEGVDKRIDVFVTAITFKANVSDLFHLDLAYAPPFSTTKDPVMYTGMILDNAINKGRVLITSEELKDLIKSGKKVEIIDTRVQNSYEKGHIDKAISVPHSQFRNSIKNMDKDTIAVTYCNKGITGNATQNILINKGFKEI
ncbi:MAG: FAD-dependent oxidoreductase, partial [Clostridiales bacterium]|nr:FAD-dependent oxidoreductase [Clostridiales bacterium]